MCKTLYRCIDFTIKQILVINHRMYKTFDTFHLRQIIIFYNTLTRKTRHYSICQRMYLLFITSLEIK